jgi:hypothetical protein
MREGIGIIENPYCDCAGYVTNSREKESDQGVKHHALTPRPPPCLLEGQQQAVIQKWDFDLSIQEVWRYICFF